MRIWLRELVGWILLGTGFGAFVVCFFAFLLQKRVCEAAALGALGFIVFRGGMHLLKVAMAARAAREAATMAAKPPVKAPKTLTLPGMSSPPGRTTPSIVPGTREPK